MITPRRMAGTDISADQDAVCCEHPLHSEASTALRGIPDQFRLNTTVHDEGGSAVSRTLSRSLRAICF
jgi:hypothetical protein